jgi:hypothetical protein
MTMPRRPTRATTVAGALLALGALLGLLAPFVARAAEPTVYLTWKAPWGEPRATDTLSTNCDSTGTDTLWLAMDPGMSSPTMLAFSVTLLFHAAPGETLSSVWRQSFIQEQPRLVIVDADPKPGLGYPQMFRTNGAGAASLDMTEHMGRLRIDYATPVPEAIGITPRVYALARVTVKRPGPADSRCGEAVCIDWSELELGISATDDRRLRTHGPHRFVSLNSPGGAILSTYREGERRAWKPPGAK